jgi:CIC family chloride channel protein
VTHQRDPQILFSNESVAQALRQLDVYGHDGLPVLSPDGQQILGWVTNAGVLRAISHQIDAARRQAPEAHLTAEWAVGDPESARREAPTPLPGYQVLEITIRDGSPAVGQPLGAITWPHGWTPVSLARDSQPGSPSPERILRAGDRVNLLAARPPGAAAARDAHAVQEPGAPPDEASRSANSDGPVT